MLPSPPKNRTEKLRQEMAERGKRDLYFMAKSILGYDALTVHTHGPICKFLDQVQTRRRMLLHPRTTFKTTIATICDSIRLVCADPSEQILIVMDTATNAKHVLQEIKQHFERNEMFRWVYKEIIPENFNNARWSSEQLEVNREGIYREPSFDAIGALGAIESRHYTHIKADDIIAEKSITSDVNMDKVIKWAGGLESLLADIKNNRIDFVGSRKKKADVYEDQIKYYGGEYEEVPIGPHAVKKGDIAIFSRHILEDNKSIFPERISMDFLVRLRKKDPERFHTQYGNSPKGTGLNTFEKEWLRYFHFDEEGQIVARHRGETLKVIDPFSLERIIFFDPSVAEKKSSSKNAILVVAKGSGPFRFVLESKIGHYPPDEAVDTLFELDAKWRPEFTSIEHRGFQGSIKYTIYDKADLEEIPYPPIMEYPPPGSPRALWAKPERIRGLQPMVRQGFLWVQDHQVNLIDELEFYPNVRWDDGLDALAQGLDYWPMSTDAEELEDKQMREADFLEKVGLGRPDRSLYEGEDGVFVLPEMNATGYRQRWN